MKRTYEELESAVRELSLRLSRAEIERDQARSALLRLANQSRTLYLSNGGDGLDASRNLHRG